MGKRFIKMHGTGNDFIIVEPDFFDLDNIRSKQNTFSEQEKSKMASLIIKLCKHHFSVGADGILVVSQVEDKQYKMSVFNSDSSMGAMCGNGLRCVAAYLSKIKQLGNQFYVCTDSGDKKVNVSQKSNHTFSVRINMGAPYQLQLLQLEQFDLQHPLYKYLKGVHPYICGLGNYHIILPLQQYQMRAIQEDNAYMKISEYLRQFKKANINFCFIESSNTIHLITCQLGAGVTFACGTGSTATAYVAFRTGRASKQVDVITRGGILSITIQQQEEQNYICHMEGPAEYVYTGCIEDDLC